MKLDVICFKIKYLNLIYHYKFERFIKAYIGTLTLGIKTNYKNPYHL